MTKGLDSIGNERTPLTELAIKMREHWHTFLQKHGPDERAWANLGPEELEYMHTKIAGWIQTCEDELAARPSPEGKDNIIDEWKRGLIHKRDGISKVIRELKKLRGEAVE